MDCNKTMERSQTVNLYITYVEKEGPFLKVWGQTEKSNSIYVEQFLLGASPQFDLGVGNVLLENLQVGTLVCAKYKDNKYYRARITNVAFLQDGFVEVSFLDYGNKDVVPCGNIRSLQNFPSSFISIPPLATGFIFAEAHCPGGGEWNEAIFENISKEIKYREVQCSLLIQATQYYLIKIFIGGSDLCGMLITRGLMQPISLQAQQAVLLSMSMQRQSLPLTHSAVPPSTGINTYKACTLEPGCQYQVYVSYVNDGPCHFSVQLKQSEEVLVLLMNDINMITLRLLEDVPIPGTICLARCQEDGNICRAVVTNELDNQFKVFYVDFGNYEVVPLDALYQIPFKYVLPKVMAIRFSLAGVEKSTVTLEMQCAFKQFVDNRLLHMKVLPTPTRTAIPKCELWDPETKTSALDVVNRAARHAYPEPISLNRGFNQPVKVSYVYSCKRFYVQLANKENDLLKLMLDLQSTCQMNDTMDPASIKVGLPCCALFESDQQWYRSQIVNVLGDKVIVRYIDYGNEETVPISKLKIIDGEQLTVLRPQAIECCLNGYQNMGEDIERDGILEELILEQLFTMKVVEMTNKKALVELFDSSNYNVSSLLLDKLAAAKSQVSPMLVQAGNKIEHRKSFSHQNGPRDQNFRQDRKPGREHKNYDRTNDRNEKPWRQENKDFRNHDKHTNENANDKGSWRENNKGFSPNNDRYNNRDRSRNRNERPAKSNSVGNTEGWSDTSPTASSVASAGNDEWKMPADSTPRNSRANNFGRGKGRYDGDKENWNSGGQRGGFKKRNDFRKDGSDVSSSGSEKSFNRGPRMNSRNDRPERSDRPRFQKKFDKPRIPPFNSSHDTNQTKDSWSVSTVSPSIDAAPVTATFTPYEVVGTEAKVVISWFHNPGHFYCQLADLQEQFKSMMEDIQQSYKSRRPEASVAGAPVVGLFPEDNVLYRAQVLEVLGTQYKVYYVDFGNVSTISKVWPIEKKFMTLPAQAIICSLSGLGPPGEAWPDADSYSKYFDKDVFVARFVNKDEERTYVNLFHGNDDISQLLVQNGLATSTETIIPDIEIPLLLGQQFRAIVKSINNPSDIIIALECGLAISCTMHNLQTATETFEDTLKGLLEQTVIVYVDNVIDDRLEVTLYDTEGSKITIVNPDEGAYDTLEVLCPALILRSVLTGYVSHVDESSIYFQPIEYADALAGLLDRMFENYDTQSQDLPIIPEEGLLYAVLSQDGNWYRGKVTSFDDEKATVYYVDYGNSENVRFLDLRELDDVFLEACALCLQVTVTVPTHNFIDKYVVVKLKYGENSWEGTVEVQPHHESSATESVETERGEAAGMTVSEPVEEFSEQNSAPEAVAQEEIVAVKTDEVAQEVPLSPAETVPVRGTQVTVSHVDSPNEFYLQLHDSLGAIKELQKNLEEQVLDMPVLENPAAGVLCAAPYSADQQWYRAEVLDADDDITTVRFVDYGNTDVIDNKSTQIKTLPPNLLSLAVYATRSSLKVKSVDDEWSSNALGMFETLTGVKVLTVEFIDQDEKTNYVELYANGENVKEALIRENLALPMELNIESKSTCFVSHLNSPSEFWIQLENCVDELEWIAEQLSGSENFPELEDLTPGTLCAALFHDDEMWYRARILSNTVAGIELLFIDYGNSCMSNSLRQLPEDLVVTAPLAQKCSLQKPEGIPYWTPQAASKFSEISADGQTIFTVRKISTGETSVVQLLIDGEDVTSMLSATTEEGRIKNVESLDSFSVEKNGEILGETFTLEAMPGMTWTDESKKKLEELAEQGTLFQIEFLSENTVRLYLDGNDIRPNLGAVKTISLNISTAEAEDDQADYETGENDNLVDETVEKDVVADGIDINNREVLETPTVSPSKSITHNVASLLSEEVEKALDKVDTKESSITPKKETQELPVVVADETAADLKEGKSSPTKAVSDKQELPIDEVATYPKKDLGEPVSPKKALEEIEASPSKEPQVDVPNTAATSPKKELEKPVSPKKVLEETEASPSKQQQELPLVPDEATSPKKDLKEHDICEQEELPIVVTEAGTEVSSPKKVVKESEASPKKEVADQQGLPVVADEALSGVVGSPKKDIKESEASPKKEVVSSEVSGSPKKDLKESEASPKKVVDQEKLPIAADEASNDVATSPKKEVSSPVAEEKLSSPLKDVPKEIGKITSDTHTDAEIISLLHEKLEKALDEKNEETSGSSEKMKYDESKNEESTVITEDMEKSRPQSAGSGKVNFDEHIVPSALSRPHSPLPVSEENESQGEKDTD